MEKKMMSDMIDRQKAIDAVHRAIFDFFDICSDDDESPITYKDEQLLEINKAITTQLRKLPSAQPEPHWIPCSERLPEEMGTYMTTIDYGKYGRHAGQRYYHGALGWEDDCVVAWMPLQEPYKEMDGG